MTCLYLVRHGATDAIGHSFSGRLSGVKLNASGLQQAEALAEHFRDRKIRSIFTSPTERARHTAAVIASARGLTVDEREAFDEIEIGQWSGRTFDHLAGNRQFQLFNSIRSLTRPPSGEMMLEVQARAVAEVLRISQSVPNSSVVIVTHGDVIKSVLGYFLGMPIDLTHRLTIDLASISRIELSTTHVQIVRINECLANLVG